MSKKRDDFIEKIREATSYNLQMNEAEEIMPFIALAVEEAYKQGAMDMKTRYSYPDDAKPQRLHGFSSERSDGKPTDIQLTTVASLYAKEQGFKP